MKVKRILILSISVLLMVSLSSFAQTRLSGKVSDRVGKSIPFANVYPLGSFDGTLADSLGRFDFTTKVNFPIKLIAGHRNYEPDTIVIRGAEQTKTIIFRLRPFNTRRLQEVVVSASSMRIGDRKGQVIMKPLDVYTNPAGGGDLSMALRQMPGLQDVGTEEGFFVRGGSGSETTISIEGIRVKRFYDKNNLNAPSRSRFETGMFRGLSLATGGYSAGKQGGLSGLLELQLAGKQSSLVSVGLSPLFASVGAGYLTPGKCFYIEQNITVSNPEVVKLFLKPEYKFPKTNANLVYTNRLVWTPSDRDNIRALVLVKRDLSSIQGPIPSHMGNSSVHYDGANSYVFGMCGWTHALKDGKTSTHLSIGGSRDDNSLDIDHKPATTPLANIKTREGDTQVRLRLNSRISQIRLATGVDYTFTHAIIKHSRAQPLSPLSEHEVGLWGEALIPLGDRCSIETGLRTEYSDLCHSAIFLPRIALAMRLHSTGTLSLDMGRYAALGDYYVRYGILPKRREQAYQANLTYEWRPSQHHLLRFQLYDKEYKSMTLIDPLHHTNHEGKGYSRGFDAFWKATGLVPNIEHWISYTYTDAKRSWLRVHSLERPDFVATHTASAVIKYWCKPISSLFNLSLSYRTGMRYQDPNEKSPLYYNKETPGAFSMSASYNYPFMIKKITGVVVLSVQNLFNSDPTYGYLFSKTPDSSGVYPSVRLSTPYRQFYLLGIFFNIGIDRRKEIMNTNL